MGKNLGVAFLWHMHQPFYKDSLQNKYLLPWVRLRGVKDYYPMAALIENTGQIKATFNFVPSLVEQIDDYARNNATDIFWDLTKKRAHDLTFEERVEILNNFFKVNFKYVIEPNPRYTELLLKKGLAPVSGSALNALLKNFSDRDILDLQVLFNLAWFHPIVIEEDSVIRELIARQRDYTEGDKEYVLIKQREIMGRILPLYRRLQDTGRIEITTTPYYHPILPLLCDTNIARIASPGMMLPAERFSHPEDAGWHIEEAIRSHTAMFGASPRGMWPSEGSVSEEALEIIASKGIEWVATDEDILFKSLALDAKGKAVEIDRQVICMPYQFIKGQKRISMVFRDKNLSDIISFNYNAWDQESAAMDLIGHLKNIAQHIERPHGKGLLTIAMDGENAWEFFKDNGRTFFETLYTRLDEDPELYSTTISGYLDGESARKTLHHVFPGSWINHNFEIWIGQDQDNMSWRYLELVRRDLVKFTGSPGKTRADSIAARKAWREFYIAEGSDWNWWYEGKVGSGKDNPFDEVYRMHLKNVYRLLKKPVPDFLNISIA